MFPVLISWRGLHLYTYGVLVALGVAAGFWLLRREAEKEGISPQRAADVAFWSVVAGLVGARLVFVLFHWSDYSSSPLKALKFWEGGLVFYGGVIPGVLVALWLIRRWALPLWKSLDVAAPSLALGHAIGRLGCFSAGCCYGKPTDLPWGVVFSDPRSLAPLGVKLHPTQLYSALGLFGILSLLLWLRRKGGFPGQVFFVYLGLYSAFRFLVEFVRGDPRTTLFWGLSHNQVVMAVLFVLSVVMLSYLKRNEAHSDLPPSRPPEKGGGDPED